MDARKDLMIMVRVMRACLVMLLWLTQCDAKKSTGLPRSLSISRHVASSRNSIHRHTEKQKLEISPPSCTYPPGPPSSPIGIAPIPPDTFPGPTGSIPIPPDTLPAPAGDMSNPPGAFPTPTGYVPIPPEAFPGPTGNIPTPPDAYPVPPSGEPGPPDFGPTPIIPGPGGPTLSPPNYEPSPPSLTPNPPAVIEPPAVFPPPAVQPPPTRTTGMALWCVVKPSVPDPIIEEAMNYACGSGADCESIQPSGSCFQPDTLYAHASYAFNSYWQRTKLAGGTCDFGGTAILVTVDPSYDGCHFL